LFLVITGNASAAIWEVKRNTAGQITEIRHRKNWPFVKRRLSDARLRETSDPAVW